jgi:hypothetical protein
MGVENGRLLATLARHGEVLSKRYTDSRVIVHCRIPQRALGHLHAEAAAIRPHGRAEADGNGQLTSGNGRAVYQEPARKADGNGPQSNGR